MLASDKLIAKLNEQVGNELGASHQYLSIASFFDRENLPELSRFFFRQAEEEREHALRFVGFVNDVDGVLQVPAVPAPKADFASAAGAVQLALEWEREVTEQIYALVEIAKQDNNLIAQRFFDWFVTEQVEEEENAQRAVDLLSRAGDNDAALLMLDREFGRRVGEEA